jgi:hypothetical protein
LEIRIEFGFCPKENFPGLAAKVGTYDAGSLELIHEAACPIVSQLKASLEEGCRAHVVLHNEACRFFEVSIPV